MEAGGPPDSLIAGNPLGHRLPLLRETAYDTLNYIPKAE